MKKDEIIGYVKQELKKILTDANYCYPPASVFADVPLSLKNAELNARKEALGEVLSLLQHQDLLSIHDTEENPMSINDFCKKINEVTRKKGFWDGMDISIEAIRNSTGYFSTDTLAATKEAFMAQKIMLIVSELAEAVEAMRNRKYGIEKKDTFEDELADAFLRLADLCGELKIDISKQIGWKMQYNEKRPYKNGKRF